LSRDSYRTGHDEILAGEVQVDAVVVIAVAARMTESN
jgi:hypothetical protein